MCFVRVTELIQSFELFLSLSQLEATIVIFRTLVAFLCTSWPKCADNSYGLLTLPMQHFCNRQLQRKQLFE